MGKEADSSSADLGLIPFLICSYTNQLPAATTTIYERNSSCANFLIGYEQLKFLLIGIVTTEMLTVFGAILGAQDRL